MRTLLTVSGAVLLLAGCVWFLQGIGVLPGSFMTGQSQWAVYGALAMIAGLVLLEMARRGWRP